MGSARVAIQAGTVPKAIPVASEIANANDITGTEGHASIGIPAMPGMDGNTALKITRVPV